jgi:hypothetical protein
MESNLLLWSSVRSSSLGYKPLIVMILRSLSYGYASKEIDSVLLMLILLDISITPFAVLICCVSNGLESGTDLVTHFANVGYLVLASCFQQRPWFNVVILLFPARPIPSHYLRASFPLKPWPSLVASSALLHGPSGLVPVPGCSGQLSGLLFPLGRYQHGQSAICFPCACIWLAVLDGIGLSCTLLLGDRPGGAASSITFCWTGPGAASQRTILSLAGI